jgi:ACS family hexuronate transporter-like MFS transporter
LRLLGYRQTWAFAAGKFLTDGVWWFFLFWLPKYLSVQYGMASTAISLPLAVLYSMTMIGSVGGGWFPTYFIRRGHGIYDGRMKAMLVIAFFPLVVLLAQPLGGLGYWVPVMLIGIGASAHQAWSANLFTTVSDMFPKASVGSVVGIGGMAGGWAACWCPRPAAGCSTTTARCGQIQTGYMIMFSFCALAYLLAWAS